MPTVHSLFKDMEVVTPREGLEKEILLAVLVVKNQKMKRRLAVSYGGITASLGALLYTGTTFGRTLLESDFWNILSLIFSDLTIAVRYSNDFLLSLLETFPAFSVATILFPIFILFMFLNMYVSTQKNQYSFNH